MATVSGGNVFIETTTNPQTGETKTTPNTGVTYGNPSAPRSGGTASQAFLGKSDPYFDIARARGLGGGTLEGQVRAANALRAQSEGAGRNVFVETTTNPRTGVVVQTPNTGMARLSGATGLVEPNLVAGAGAASLPIQTRNVRPQAGAESALDYAASSGLANPAGAIAFGAVNVEKTGKKYELLSQQVGKEKTYAIRDLKTGEVKGLPSNPSAKGIQVRDRIFEVAEKSPDKLASATIFSISRQAGLPGNAANPSLFVASLNDNLVVDKTNQVNNSAPNAIEKIIKVNANPVSTISQGNILKSPESVRHVEVKKDLYVSQPEQDPNVYFANLNENQLKAYQKDSAGNILYFKVGKFFSPVPAGGSETDLSSEAVAGKKAFRALNPLEKVAQTTSATLLSKEGFNIYGSAVQGKADKAETLIVEARLAQQKRLAEEKGLSIGQFGIGKQLGGYKATAKEIINAPEESPVKVLGEGVAFGYAIPAVAGLAGTIGVAGLTGLYSKQKAAQAGASEAEQFKAGAEGAVVGGVLGKLGDIAVKNPSLAAKLGLVVEGGIVGLSGLFGGEQAKAEGKDVKTGQIAGLAKGLVFVGGGRAGSKLAEAIPFPLKTESIRTVVGTEKVIQEQPLEIPSKKGFQIQTSGSLTNPNVVIQPIRTRPIKIVKQTLVEQPVYRESFKGLTFTDSNGKVNVIIGKTEKGNLIVNRFPNVKETPSLKLFGKAKSNIVLESGAEVEFYAKPDILKSIGASKEEIEKIQSILPVVRATQRTESIFADKLPEETQTSGKDYKLALKKLKDLGINYRLYGSFTAKGQLAPEFKNYVPADLDIELKTSSSKVAEKAAKDIAETLNKQGKSGFTYRVSKENPTLVESSKVGENSFRHAFDIHFEGQPADLTLGAAPSGNKLLGLPINQESILLSGEPAQRLSEQGIRKVGSTLTLRSGEKGAYFAPEEHRFKDIVDAYTAQKSLLFSKEAKGEFVGDLYPKLESYQKAFQKTGQLTEDVLKERGLKFELGSEGKSIRPVSPSVAGKVSSSKIISIDYSNGKTQKSIRLSNKINDFVSPRGSFSSSTGSSYKTSTSTSSYNYPSPSLYKSPSVSPSIDSPSPSSPSTTYPSNYSSVSINYKSISPSAYKSPSSSASPYYKFNYEYNYKYPSGGASPANEGTGGRYRIQKPQKGKAQKIKLFPSLISISRQQAKTGSLFYRAPSTKAILRSATFRRTGGEIVPVSEGLKEKGLQFAKFLFKRGKGQTAIFNFAGLFVLLLFFAFSLDAQLLVANFYVNNQVTGTYGSVLSTVIISVFSFFLFAGMFLTMISNRSSVT